MYKESVKKNFRYIMSKCVRVVFAVMLHEKTIYHVILRNKIVMEKNIMWMNYMNKVHILK